MIHTQAKQNVSPLTHITFLCIRTVSTVFSMCIERRIIMAGARVARNEAREAARIADMINRPVVGWLRRGAVRQPNRIENVSHLKPRCPGESEPRGIVPHACITKNLFLVQMLVNAARVTFTSYIAGDTGAETALFL